MGAVPAASAAKRSLSILLLGILFVSLTIVGLWPGGSVAAQIPGETVLTQGDTTFRYRITTLYDGTGHDAALEEQLLGIKATTPEQPCFIRAANGYPVGDNSGDDGYVCHADRVFYQVNWSMESDSGGTINLEVKNTAATSKVSLPTWAWGLATDQYTFTSTANKASLTFTGATNKSGSFLLSTTPRREFGQFNENIDVSLTAKLGTQTGVSQTDRPVKVLAATRFDLTPISMPADSTTTTINDTSYIGIPVVATSHSFVESGEIGPRQHNTVFPDFSATKGYLTNWGWLGGQVMDSTETSSVRFSLEKAPPGTLVAVDGGTPSAPSWDGTTAYVDGSPRASVKYYLPWAAVPAGSTPYVVRVDPVDRMWDDLGQQTFAPGQLDPGKGLPCTTTTLNVLPGSQKGPVAGLPNNNCWQTSVDKLGFGGGFKKTDHPPNWIEIDGHLVPRSALASDLNGTPTGWSGVRTDLTFAPNTAFPNRDMSVCDVWDGDQMKLTNATLYTNGVALTTAVPTAQVLYTTKDLRPTDGTKPPRCGNAADWSATVPTDLSTVSGIKVVIPGTDVLIQQMTINAYKAPERADMFDALVTPFVTNYMGVSHDTRAATPTWSAATDHITVVKGAVLADAKPQTPTDQTNVLAMGTQTVTTEVATSTRIWGVVPSDATSIERVYLDQCATDVHLASVPSDVVSHKLVGTPGGECGLAPGQGYYLEVTRTLSKTSAPALRFTWTSPQWAMPGDSFSFSTALFAGDDGAYGWQGTGHTLTYNVAQATVTGSEKSTPTPTTPIESSFTYRVGWMNYSEHALGRATFIDVLPHTGDGRGTSFHGTTTLQAVTEVPAATGRTTLEYTKRPPADVSSDPEDASNAAGGTTRWCLPAQFGTTECPAGIAEATAIRFVTDDLGKNARQYFEITMAGHGNKKGDVYVNRLSAGAVVGLTEPLPAPPAVKVTVYDLSITGMVYVDGDADGDRQNGEQGLAGQTVTLVLPDGSTRTTQTKSDGSYVFDTLSPGAYTVRTGMPDDYSQVTENGADDTLSGEATLTLTHTDASNVDFGLVPMLKLPVHIVKQAANCDVSTATCGLGGARFAVYASAPGPGVDPIADAVIVDTTSTNGVPGSTFTTVPLVTERSYWLVETTAPAGHQLLPAPIPFTLTGHAVTLVNPAPAGAATVDGFTLTVTDVTTGQLPLAGGGGPWRYLLVGLLLFGAAGVIQQRRQA